MKKYKVKEVPFQYISSNVRDEEQATHYLRWFVEQTDSRIKMLQQYIENTNHVTINLDKTPGSLVSLWEWFQDRIEYEKTGANQLATRIEEDKPDALQSVGIELSDETLALIEDISLYFAETMIHNNKAIHWGNKLGLTEVEQCYMPILHGFKKESVSVNQNNIVLVCTLRSIKKKNSLELYEAYNIWKEYVG